MLKAADQQRRHRPRPFARAVKRTVDVIGALAGLVALSPVLAGVAVAVRVRLGRPVLFIQPRPGRNGRIFSICKFRTMTEERDEHGYLLPDERRLTKLGRFLRSSSVDELPELLNVLRGHMSLVGPRPLLVDYLDRYSPRQALRHSVRPGITGWCQVNGRNLLSWEDKFELDAWYAEHWSLPLDLRILAATVKTVLLRRGISNQGHATMPPFLGSTGPHPSTGGAS
jgi:lipopolysaccharide/colanic/teichoic acid biosynthesis glycosyltransferase